MKNDASSKNHVLEEYVMTWKGTGMQCVYNVKSKSEYEAGHGFYESGDTPGRKRGETAMC